MHRRLADAWRGKDPPAPARGRATPPDRLLLPAAALLLAPAAGHLDHRLRTGAATVVGPHFDAGTVDVRAEVAGVFDQSDLAALEIEDDLGEGGVGDRGKGSAQGP